MKTADFEWFDYQGTEEAEVRKIKRERSIFERLFGFFSAFVFMIFIVSFVAAFILKFITDEEYYVYGVEIRDINKVIITITVSFRMILFMLFLIRWCLEYLGFRLYANILQVISKYIAIFLWMGVCLVKIDNGKLEYLKVYCYVVMISSFTFGVLSLSMLFLQYRLIKATMETQMKETDITENILKIFKKFIRENSGGSTDSTDNLFPDVYYIDFSNVISTCATLDEGYNNTKSFGIEPPEISNLNEAIELSRDVFNKAVADSSSMNIEDFRHIFDSDDQFQKALPLFDINHEKSLSSKDFRNTVIELYHKRALLSKSIISKLQFSFVIEKLLAIICVMFLFIIGFILIGINLKKLLALVISSAIVVNFTGSEVVKDMWRSIVFVISHQFDIGDDVIIDDKEMTVFDIGILSTSFVLSNGGKIKISNSNLWGKVITNMTKAPEKLLLFTFELKSGISPDEIILLKKEITAYLNKKRFDLLDTFVLDTSIPNYTSIDSLKTAVIIKCKNYNSKSKRFIIRAEFSAFLKNILNKIKILTSMP